MLRLVVIVLLSLGAITASRLAFAELLARRDTPESLRQAARLAPKAEYLERLAELDPDHARQILSEALALNPRSSEAWIALGLAAERSRDFAEAAQDLAEAARVDRQYLPAWTLANFYFRRGERTPFREWAQRAAALSYDDLGPLLTLADRMQLPERTPLDNNNERLTPREEIARLRPREEIARLTPREEIARLTPREEIARPTPQDVVERLEGGSAAQAAKIERAYLDLLIHQARLGDAQAIARMILARSRAGRGADGDMSRLRAFTTRLIAANRGADALEIWNGIRALSSLTVPPADLAGSADGSGSWRFDDASSGEGFDWRVPSSTGISFVSKNSILNFILDGGQPATCPLLERIIAVPIGNARRHGRVRFEYRTGLRGLRWTFDGHESAPLETSASLSTPLYASLPSEISAPSRPLTSLEALPSGRASPSSESRAGWREGEWRFTPAPSSQEAVSLRHLVLFYRRDSSSYAPGNVRTEGRLEIRNLLVVVE